METATETSSAAGSAPAPESSFQDGTFAGLLAALAVPQACEDAWNDEDLADDVATISHEPALRADMRVSPGSSDLRGDPEKTSACGRDQAGPKRHSNAGPASNVAKTARLTIRLSEGEFAQLRERAAEAGMSVSCYLRSCTLEVESLRMEVKAALADMRNSTYYPAKREPEAEASGGFGAGFDRLLNRIRHIVPRRRPGIRLNAANPFAPIR